MLKATKTTDSWAETGSSFDLSVEALDLATSPGSIVFWLNREALK